MSKINWDNVDSIIEHFGFVDSDDQIEITKKLKQIRKTLHPDNTGGEFKSKKDERDYYEVESAIEFMEKNNGEKLPMLYEKKLQELEGQIKSMQELRNTLPVNDTDKNSFDLVDGRFKGAIKIKGISSLLMAAISIFWLVPNKISENPFLSDFVSNPIVIQCWIVLFVLLVFSWIGSVFGDMVNKLFIDSAFTEAMYANVMHMLSFDKTKTEETYVGNSDINTWLEYYFMDDLKNSFLLLRPFLVYRTFRDWIFERVILKKIKQNAVNAIADFAIKERWIKKSDEPSIRSKYQVLIGEKK